jgi:anti-anti-sigma factor
MVGDIVVLDIFSGKTVGSEQIERASNPLLTSGDVRHLVLNLSSVKFASSSFIAGLVALHKKLRSADGKLVLCALRPVVREVLHGARLDKFFEIADDEEKALASL